VSAIKLSTVLITGGSGLLALNWACAVRDNFRVVLGTHRHRARLAGTESVTLDLNSPEHLARQIDELAPDLIVHMAGLSSVDACEADPALTRYVNAELARNVAMVAAERGIGLIHISTDHLFGGSRSFYREDDRAEPINEYARSKLLAEEWVQQAHPQALILRTNFFGWGHAQRQSFSDWIIYGLRSGTRMTLFDDVHFTPILADSLALAAHRLIAKSVSGIVNLVGDERISKYQFALRLAKAFGLPEKLIERGKLVQLSLSAPRPLDMSLDNGKARTLLGDDLGRLDDFFTALKHQEANGRKQELFSSVL